MARRTIIFVTHDVDEAVFLANRVVVMFAVPRRNIQGVRYRSSVPSDPRSKEEPGVFYGEDSRLGHGVQPCRIQHRVSLKNDTNCTTGLAKQTR